VIDPRISEFEERLRSERAATVAAAQTAERALARLELQQKLIDAVIYWSRCLGWSTEHQLVINRRLQDAVEEYLATRPS